MISYNPEDGMLSLSNPTKLSVSYGAIEDKLRYTFYLLKTENIDREYLTYVIT